jgi:hypothetical protein
MAREASGVVPDSNETDLAERALLPLLHALNAGAWSLSAGQPSRCWLHQEVA